MIVNPEKRRKTTMATTSLSSNHPPRRPAEISLGEARTDARFAPYRGNVSGCTGVFYLFNEKGQPHGRALYELQGGADALRDPEAKLQLLFTFHEVSGKAEFFDVEENIMEVQTIPAAIKRLTFTK